MKEIPLLWVWIEKQTMKNRIKENIYFQVILKSCVRLKNLNHEFCLFFCTQNKRKVL